MAVHDVLLQHAEEALHGGVVACPPAPGPSTRPWNDGRELARASYDLSFVSAVYGELFPANPEFGVDDVLELLSREPALSRTSADAARNAALDGLDTGAMER